MMIRETLKNGNRAKINLNMEKIYKQLDSGRSVQSVAKEWGVSVSTLYRRHREYQKELRHRAYQKELEHKMLSAENEFPPIPEDLRQELP